MPRFVPQWDDLRAVNKSLRGVSSIDRQSLGGLQVHWVHDAAPRNHFRSLGLFHYHIEFRSRPVPGSSDDIRGRGNRAEMRCLLSQTLSFPTVRRGMRCILLFLRSPMTAELLCFSRRPRKLHRDFPKPCYSHTSQKLPRWRCVRHRDRYGHLGVGFGFVFTE